jgi:hypothetical protein
VFSGSLAPPASLRPFTCAQPNTSGFSGEVLGLNVCRRHSGRGSSWTFRGRGVKTRVGVSAQRCPRSARRVRLPPVTGVRTHRSWRLWARLGRTGRAGGESGSIPGPAMLPAVPVCLMPQRCACGGVPGAVRVGVASCGLSARSGSNGLYGARARVASRSTVVRLDFYLFIF